jgi:hypothetical protein
MDIAAYDGVAGFGVERAEAHLALLRELAGDLATGQAAKA